MKIEHSRERGLQLQTSTLGPGGEGPGTREGRGQEAGPMQCLRRIQYSCSVVLVTTTQCEFLVSRQLSCWLFKVVLQKSPGTKNFAQSTAGRMGLVPETHRQVATAKETILFMWFLDSFSLSLVS